MNKSNKLVIVILIFMLMFTGCNGNKEIVEEKPKGTVREYKKKVEVDEAVEKLKSLSIDEKIGQLLIVGLEGTEINEQIEEMIKDYYIGGFILFERNISNGENTLDLINSIKSLNKTNKVPLFISIDEEGGNVSRLPNEFIKLPNAWDIGKVNNKEYSYKMGQIIGERLQALGINLNFAPILDINSNPSNPVIGKRAFGSTVEEVNKHGIQTMEGIKSKNIIPVLKHFPGHGDTNVDSHLDLPVINKTIEELEKLELAPFKKGIEKNADMIMTSHILFPKIDKNNPATFSKEIITNILREKLKFNGAIITDDMTMGGLKNYHIVDASVEALKAGCDIILMCHGYENQVKIIEKIKEEVKEGNIPEKEIDEKVYRILKLKEKYKITNKPVELSNIEEINSKTKLIIKQYTK